MQVELIGIDAQDVPGRPGLHRGTQPAAQPPHERVHGVAGPWRHVVGPDQFDEAVGGHHPAGVQQQHGEHAPPVREGICARLGHLGLCLDPSRNAASAPVISADHSSCTVRIVPADEERSISRHTAHVLAKQV